MANQINIYYINWSDLFKTQILLNGRLCFNMDSELLKYGEKIRVQYGHDIESYIKADKMFGIRLDNSPIIINNDDYLKKYNNDFKLCKRKDIYYYIKGIVVMK